MPRKSRCNSGKKKMAQCKADGCTWVHGSRASGRKGYCRKQSKRSRRKSKKSRCHSKKSLDCKNAPRCQYRRRSRTRSGRMKRKSVCAKKPVYRGIESAIQSDASIIYRARRRCRRARKCSSDEDNEEEDKSDAEIGNAHGKHSEDLGGAAGVAVAQ